MPTKQFKPTSPGRRGMTGFTAADAVRRVTDAIKRPVDVAIVNIQSSDLSILFGRGDGTFEYPPRNYRTKPGPFALATFRVTTKEVEEPGLVTADNGNGSISIFLHRGLYDVCREMD